MPKSPAENSAFSRDSFGPWGGGGEEWGEGRGEEDKIGMKFEKKVKFDSSGSLLATAQNYLLHSSLPLC